MQDDKEIIKAKLKAATLIRDVLFNKKNVSTALSLFPKGTNDINIKCAFDALMHREADEDLREKINDYAAIQDNFLADIALILAKNEQLPQNVIAQYLKFHETDILPDNLHGIKSVFKNIKRMINF